METIIRNPYAPGKHFKLKLEKSFTVLQLKEKLRQDYDSHPPVKKQRIVHNGRLLSDSVRLEEITNGPALVLHLVVKGLTLDSIVTPSYSGTPFPVYTQYIPQFSVTSNGHGVKKHKLVKKVKLEDMQSREPAETAKRAPHRSAASPRESKTDVAQQLDAKSGERPQAQPNRYINLKLAAKLLVLIFLFGQDGDSTRLFMLCFAAVITYIHQMGFLWNAIPRQFAPNGIPEARQPAPMEAVDTRRGRTGTARPLSAVSYVERFIVGFFASLIPSWRPHVS
mmetsp:Transcript_319/g.844  ORF Transcript_319/g.844 Transcript_319/m.844 type:complete len:280 (-) Transcript_319:263-1102(-)